MSRRRGYIYAMIAALTYSVVAIFGKYALEAGMVPEGITFWQYVITTLTMALYFLITDRSKFRISRSLFLRFAAVGVFGSMMTNFFYYHALKHLNAGIASMLLFSAPFLINLFFLVSGIRRIPLWNFLPIALGLLGNFLALNLIGETNLQFSGLGIFFGILSAVFFSFYTVFMDIKLKNIDPMQLNLFAALSGMIVSGIYNATMQPQAFTVVPGSWYWVGLNAIFAMVIPVYFAYHSLQIIGADKSSIISAIELPFTLVVAFLVLGETLSAVQLIGMSFIIFSIVLLRIIESRLAKPLHGGDK